MKKYLATTAAFLAAAGFMVGAETAQAYNAVDHVYVNAEGVGDALIFPMFYAGGTWSTDIKVVNTSNVYSQVAKVVLRESTTSCEILDFLIYLSPNDVWTATIYAKNGSVYIKSTDDSSPVNPMDQILTPGCNNNFSGMGYVEVYGARTLSINTGLSTMPIVPKDCVKSAYNASATTLTNCVVGSGTASCNLDSDTDLESVTYSSYCTLSTLAGVADVMESTTNTHIPMVATAMANLVNNSKLTVGAETRWDTVSFNNSVAEVRAALSKGRVHIPYKNDSANTTFLAFTWPAKFRCNLTPQCQTGRQVACDMNGDGDTVDSGDVASPSTQYSLNTYDLSENTTTSTTIFSPAPVTMNRFDNEVEFYQLSPPYSEGWVRVVFSGYPTDGVTCNGEIESGLEQNGTVTVTHDGSAMIPNYMHVAGNTMAFFPASYDGATVTSGTTTFNNNTYQTTSANMMPAISISNSLAAAGIVSDATDVNAQH